MKQNYQKLLKIINVMLLFGLLLIINSCDKSQKKVTITLPDSASKYFYLTKYIGGDSKKINYLYSTDDNFSNPDTLQTELYMDNYLVKMFDNEGLVITDTVTRYTSSDNLFDGYVDFSTPVWNEENQNIISAERKGENLNYAKKNIYKYNTYKILAGSYNVFAGWNPKIPANFISQRDTTETSENERNIIYIKTIEPLSKDVTEPLDFWAETGGLKSLRDLKNSKYTKQY